MSKQKVSVLRSELSIRTWMMNLNFSVLRIMRVIIVILQWLILTLKPYVMSSRNKALQKFHALSRARNYITFKHRKIIMQCFIFSQFECCSVVWMCHGEQLNNCVNRIHERILRLVYRDTNSHFSDLLAINSSLLFTKKRHSKPENRALQSWK